MVTWQRHPGVSLLTLLATVVLFATSLVYAILYAWSDFQWLDGQWNGDDIARFDLLLHVFAAIMGLVAWILLLLAILGGRSPSEGQRSPRFRPLPEDDEGTDVLSPDLPPSPGKES